MRFFVNQYRWRVAKSIADRSTVISHAFKVLHIRCRCIYKK